MIDDESLKGTQAEPVDSTEFIATVLKELEVAFHQAEPNVVPTKPGETQGSINPSSIATELASLAWTSRRAGIWEGRSRIGSVGLWIGAVRKDGFSFTNIGAESHNNIIGVSAILPDVDNNVAGFLKVDTPKAVLMYQDVLVRPKV